MRQELVTLEVVEVIETFPEELLLPEVNAIIQRALNEDVTDEIVAQIYKVTGGIHRHIDMIIARILDLNDILRFSIECD